MSDFAKSIIDVAAAQEMEAASALMSSEQAEKNRQQEEAERLALEAKRVEQQAIFRKEIEPAINLVQALDAAQLVHPAFPGTDDEGSSFRINAGIPLGYKYKVAYLTPKGDRENSMSLSRDYEYYDDYEYDDLGRNPKRTHFREIIEEVRGNAELTTTVPEQNSPNKDEIKNKLKGSEKKYETFGPFYEPYGPDDSTETYIRHLQGDSRIPPHFSSHYYEMSEEKKGGYQGVFYGAVFERGKTTPEDINDFITGLVKLVYEKHRDNPKNLDKFRKILQKQFQIDLDSVTQSARMVAVARNFRAVANDDIQMAKPKSELDLSVLDKTQDDIRDEIQAALKSNDALAILKIGENILDVSRGLISELANDMLPAAMGDDYELLQSIQRDLTSLRPAEGSTKKRGIGEMLLGKVKRSQSKALSNDPHASISTNFTSLSISLKQRREVVERRAGAIQSKASDIQKLCDLIETYKEEIDVVIEGENDPIKSADLAELKQIFSINAIATHSGRQGIVSAVATEKKAFLALQKTANAIPLLASSLIQAINKMRAQQSNTMIAGAEAATKVLLEDLSDGTKGLVLDASSSVSGVFEVAEKHIGVIQGHMQQAGKYLQESEDAIQTSALEAQEHLLDN